MLFDLSRDRPEPVGIRELIEQQFRALLVRRLRALVNGRAFVRLKVNGELIDRLKTHCRRTESSE
jgi:hypothetical protein